MEKIGVFCSAAQGLPESFTQAARQLGQWMGQKGMTLVYGGVRKGLMAEVSLACHEAGGRLYGIYPSYMEERGFTEPDLDVCLPTAGLTDRKDLLLLNSEALVALPGGIGTLDEVFTLMGLMAAGEVEKPLFLLNVDGYWEPLLRLMEHMHRQGMLRHPADHYYRVAGTVQELIQMLEN